MTMPKLEWERGPYLAAFGEKGITRDQALFNDPKTRPLVVAEMQTHMLGDSDFDYYKSGTKGSAEHLWIGGMMKWVVNNIYVLTDDPDSGIFLFYNTMNSADYLTFLGKLRESSKIAQKARRDFKKFLKSVSS